MALIDLTPLVREHLALRDETDPARVASPTPEKLAALAADLKKAVAAADVPRSFSRKEDI